MKEKKEFSFCSVAFVASFALVVGGWIVICQHNPAFASISLSFCGVIFGLWMLMLFVDVFRK